MNEGDTTVRRVLARLFLAPVFVVSAGLAVIAGGVGASSAVVWVGLGLVVTGLATTHRASSLVTRLGLGLVALALVARTFLARGGGGRDGARGDVSFSLVTVKPSGTRPTSRLVTRWLDEASVVLPAARLLAPPTAHARMRAEYASFRDDEGEAPSPLLASWLGLEGTRTFDLVRFAPRAGPRRGTVVFLHGSFGAFVLPCRHIARAVAPVGIATACPSRGVFPSWGSDEGRIVVERTLAEAEGPVVLVGLSDGAEGASLLAPRLGRAKIAGLVLLSGAAPDADAPPVPTLVLAGDDDRGGETAYAARHAATGLVAQARVPGGHFAMLEAADRVDAALRGFVTPIVDEATHTHR